MYTQSAARVYSTWGIQYAGSAIIKWIHIGKCFASHVNMHRHMPQDRHTDHDGCLPIAQHVLLAVHTRFDSLKHSAGLDIYHVRKHACLPGIRVPGHDTTAIMLSTDSELSESTIILM